MTNSIILIGTGAAMIACWLVAGVFFTFSDFLMKSFAALPADQGARAMQAINVQVYRSAFIVSFFVVAGLGVSLAAYTVFGATIAGTVWVIAGTLLYLLAVVLCTVAANVPMNETLAGLDAATPQAADYWAHYLSRWTKYNHIRTAGSVMAALCFSWAFVLQVQL